MNRIRPSRRLETESKRNVEVMWLLKKLTPDHKTIARFRHDNAAALRNVFRDFVKLCLKLGLCGRDINVIKLIRQHDDGYAYRAGILCFVAKIHQETC